MAHSLDPHHQIHEEVIFRGTDFQKKLLQLIQRSEREILISCYIFESDEFGNQILEALKERARTGVSVKVCVDGYGSRSWFENLDLTGLDPHFEARVYHPLPWPFGRLFRADIDYLNDFFDLLYLANNRNHQKLFIFDQASIMLGSRNIHNEALDWRETTIVFNGPVIADAVGVFFNLWDRSHTQDLKRRLQNRLAHYSFQSERLFSNHFPALRKNRNYALINRIIGARKNIHITTPYFLPTPLVLKLLCQRAKRGIDVVILLPNLTDVKLSKWLAQSYYYLMIQSGIKIYEYSAAILHAKTAIIDEWALVGSSNLNHRSTIRDLEIDYSPVHAHTIHSIKRRFQDDIASSERMLKVAPMNIFLRLFMSLISRLFHSWF